MDSAAASNCANLHRTIACAATSASSSRASIAVLNTMDTMNRVSPLVKPLLYIKINCYHMFYPLNPFYLNMDFSDHPTAKREGMEEMDMMTR